MKNKTHYFLKPFMLSVLWLTLFSVSQLQAQTGKPVSGFHMIIASDTQYPWYKEIVSEPNDVGKAKRISDQDNGDFVKTMNDLTNQLGNVKGVIFNGDLTNYGHGWQLDRFKEIYKGLKAPMHVALGNHDYANNVEASYENGAPNTMVEYMVEQLKAKNYPNSDYKVENGYDGTAVTTISGSLAYSWNEGNVHFVQLQYYPLYEREWSNYVTIGAAKRKTVKITNSFQWLTQDLAAARNAGNAIIVLFHDPYEHWSDQYTKGVKIEGNPVKTRIDADARSKELANLFKTYKVSAVFGGHIHQNHGLTTDNYRGSGVPLFYSGSADYNHYLLTKFDNDKMTVEKVTSTNGAIKREPAGEYPLFTPKPAAACGCAPKTFRNVSEHSWVEFRLPQGTGGQDIAIAGGAYNKYVFPKCNRVWWDNLSFKCNAATCQWEKVAGKWDADALCTGDKGKSPYVFVGNK